jgi:hypothetical protein
MREAMCSDHGLGGFALVGAAQGALAAALLVAFSTGLATRAAADLTFYTDRGTFEAAFPQLPCEDFEEGNVLPSSVVGCPAPLDETNNDSCFSPGDIEPGIEFVDDPGPDTIDGLVLLGPGFGGAPSKNVIANTFIDTYVINFTDGDTQAAGMDLVAYFSNDTCDIDIFGAGGLLGSTTAPCTNAGSFWGVSSNVESIVRIDVTSPTDQSEGVDNICFGAGNQPPVASCIESVNPSGKNTPPAGSTTLPGSKGGQNEDGFYELVGEDAEDGTALVFVTNASGSATFGPFSSGLVVKITEAPGRTPTAKSMGGPNSAVAAHITLDSDAFVFAVDSSGEESPVVSCLVPPPPK